MASRQRLLIVDDDRSFFETANIILAKRFACLHAPTGEEGLKEDLGACDAVLLDIELGHGMDGFQVLEKLQKNHPGLPVVIISRRDDIKSVVRAMRLGASDYIGKNFNLEELALKVGQALDRKRLEEEKNCLRDEIRERVGRLVGDSAAMEAVRDSIGRAAQAPSPVLITGESGTGKELVARDIHDLGPQADRPFVAVNCAAVPETLFESILFGHEKGAFTGADRRRKGHIERAGKGTLFLDEIAEMPAALQSKLLRVIQEKRFERVGSAEPLPMNARVIAATNRDIEDEVEKGRFRSDLFYRLNVVRIHIPPLRERLDDLQALVPYFLERKAHELKIAMPQISPEALQSLQGWRWPGNVRELENAIESALVQAGGGDLEPDSFPALRQGRFLAAGFHAARRQVVEDFERQYVRATLQTCGGNVSEAARRMDISRFGLQKMMKRLGMDGGAGREGGGLS